jgi:hypothetical protein
MRHGRNRVRQGRNFRWTGDRKRGTAACVLLTVLCARSLGQYHLSEHGKMLMSREPKLSQAIWNRGSETRLKRFFAKAKRGEGVTVGVIGGSGRSFCFADEETQRELKISLQRSRPTPGSKRSGHLGREVDTPQHAPSYIRPS